MALACAKHHSWWCNASVGVQTGAAPAPVNEDMASALVNEFVASVHVIEYVASAPVTTLLEPPVPVVHSVQVPQVHAKDNRDSCSCVRIRRARTCRHSHSTCPVIEDVMLAPANSETTPAPVIDFVAPSPVIEYIVPATSVTHVTPSARFSPAHTMAAVTTGVSRVSFFPVGDLAQTALCTYPDFYVSFFFVLESIPDIST